MVGSLAELGEAEAPFNDPRRHDLDVVCINMCTLDLLLLLGNIARPIIRQIVIKDHDSFNNWIHVIFDPVVVKIYEENNVQ